jgi:shikimate dehydrogenase
MPPSFPILCCSFSGRASKVGVQYHNAAYRALGLDYTYVAFSIEDLPSAVQALRTLNIRGCGVSMPHKEAIIPYLDRLDPVAEVIKSVNTVVNDGGELTGYNVDWFGAKRALEEVTSLVGKEAVVVGAGGASRAVVYALASSGARVRVYNRTLAKATALVEEFGLLSGHSLSELPQAGHYHILVNTTSVGYRAPGATIVPAELLKPDRVVMDIVSEPLETTLLAQAKGRGAHCVPGYRMRLFQAGEQFRLYTGIEPPLDTMEAALLASTQAK